MTRSAASSPVVCASAVRTAAKNAAAKETLDDAEVEKLLGSDAAIELLAGQTAPTLIWLFARLEAVFASPVSERYRLLTRVGRSREYLNTAQTPAITRCAQPVETPVALGHIFRIHNDSLRPAAWPAPAAADVDDEGEASPSQPQVGWLAGLLG